VVEADLGVLAQAVPGDRIRFQPVDPAASLAALLDQEARLDAMLRGGHPPVRRMPTSSTKTRAPAWRPTA